MKKHAIIPIFIPHEGCPHDCIFCNQRAITAHTHAPSAAEVTATVDTWLTTLADVETVEVAFYGGSFTAIPLEEQNLYLSLASAYKSRGLIDRIHLSTRPDAISRPILDNLKAFGVDTIELGVQSFDPHVLALSARGHDTACIYESSKLIQSYGFELGIQLMIGLPGDSRESCLFSARETVRLAPSIARLYPTVVIQGTALYEQYRRGDYVPLSEDEAILRTKEMYQILTAAGINVIRIGLKSSDIMTEGAGAAAGTFHPAFRQLVEGQIARESLEGQLEELLAVHSAALSQTPACDPQAAATASQSPAGRAAVTFACHPRSFSNMIGNGARNRTYFQSRYPDLDFRFQVDASLEPGIYTVR